MATQHPQHCLARGGVLMSALVPPDSFGGDPLSPIQQLVLSLEQHLEAELLQPESQPLFVILGT